MQLDESAVRAKVIELLDGMSQTRMDLWVMSGTLAGVFPDTERVMQIMEEELPKRAPDVIAFWTAPCTCNQVPCLGLEFESES